MVYRTVDRGHALLQSRSDNGKALVNPNLYLFFYVCVCSYVCVLTQYPAVSHLETPVPCLGVLDGSSLMLARVLQNVCVCVLVCVRLRVCVCACVCV